MLILLELRKTNNLVRNKIVQEKRRADFVYVHTQRLCVQGTTRAILANNVLR